MHRKPFGHVLGHVGVEQVARLLLQVDFGFNQLGVALLCGHAAAL